MYVSDLESIGTIILNNMPVFIVMGVMVYYHGRKLDIKMDKMDNRMDRMDQRMDKMDERWERTNQRLDALYSELISLRKGN